MWFLPRGRQRAEPAPDPLNRGAAAHQRGTLHARDRPDAARDSSRAGEAADLQDSQGRPGRRVFLRHGPPAASHFA